MQLLWGFLNTTPLNAPFYIDHSWKIIFSFPLFAPGPEGNTLMILLGITAPSKEYLSPEKP